MVQTEDAILVEKAKEVARLRKVSEEVNKRK